MPIVQFVVARILQHYDKVTSSHLVLVERRPYLSMVVFVIGFGLFSLLGNLAIRLSPPWGTGLLLALSIYLLPFLTIFPFRYLKALKRGTNESEYMQYHMEQFKRQHRDSKDEQP